MGLKEVLAKMKLVEIEEGAPSPSPPPGLSNPPARSPAAPGPAPRPAAPAGPPDLAAILKSIPGVGPIEDEKLAAPAPPVRSPAPMPAAAAAEAPELSGGGGELPGFDAVYQSAKIVDPPHGFSAPKVLEMLNSEGLASLDTRAKAAAMLGFLKMNPSGAVPIHEVIQDAVRRDQALDRFEEFLQQKVAKRSDEVEKENAALQAEIDQLTVKNRDKMAANRKAMEAEIEQLREWQVRKRIEERRLFDAVAPFVEDNPVTTQPEKGPTAPE
ncbi:MAG: hypothetical protein U0002_10000 [Thermoanaerobaculia bacterium]